MLKLLLKNKKTLIIALGIVLLAFVFRVINLTIIPVFGDEAIYIRWSQIMRAEPTLRFIPLSDGKQPLFMWATIPLLKIFSDPLLAGRIVSVFSGVSTLLGIFFLSYLLFKSLRVALSASFLYAISPFTVFFDRLALADSMLSSFGVWVLVFSIITVRKIRLDSAMLAGFALGGALLTKSPALFFSLLLPLSLYCFKWPKGFKQQFNSLCVFVFLFSVTYIIAYGIYNILRLGPNFQMISLRNQDYVYPLSHILNSPLDPLKPFISRTLEYMWILGPWPILFLTVFGVFYGLISKRKETFLLLAWLFIPLFAVTEYSKVLTARYIYFIAPYLFTVSGITFLNLKSSLLKNLSLLLLLVFSVIAVGADFRLLSDPQKVDLPRSERSGYLEDWTSGYGIKEISEIVREEHLLNPTKKIVVGTEGSFGTLPDGLQMYLNDLPAITVIGVGLSFNNLPLSLIDSQKAGNITYLVVNNTRYNGNARSEGLDHVAVFGKAVRPDGSREALLLFKLTDKSLQDHIE